MDSDVKWVHKRKSKNEYKARFSRKRFSAILTLS